MKVPPKMFRGAYCAALRFAMNEVRTGCRESNVEKQARGGARGKSREREKFAQGRWVELQTTSATCKDSPRPQTSGFGAIRAGRAESLAHVGELMSKGDHVKPGFPSFRR